MKLEGTTLVVKWFVVVLLEMRVSQNEFRRRKKPDHLITVLQELIKMRCCEQKTTHVPFSSIIAKGGFVQKRRISTH
jgi:hypothetical protein